MQQIFENKIGVIYKIKATEFEAIGNCNFIDKVVINSVIYTENDATTLIKFESVRDRFYADKFYCVDMVFSYLEDMKINDVIKDRVKHFEVTLINVETN